MPEQQAASRRKLPPEHARFKPGVSGNPGGRPTGSASIVAALRRLVDEKAGASPRRSPEDPKRKADVIAERLLELATTENGKDPIAAIKVILDRIDGPVKTEITGAGGGPLFAAVPLSPISPAAMPREPEE